MEEALAAMVARHYGLPDLRNRVLAAVGEAGLDPERLDPAALAAVDEFHVGGRSATAYVTQQLGLRRSDRVIDIGCGLGGVSRYMAKQFGCTVTGVDLTPEYVDTARELNRRTGLANNVEVIEGSALDLPYPDATFDCAVTFHVAMNIADRGRFYGEAYRVLKPGASLAMYDITKGPADGMLFPVPWAESADTSFLVTAADMRRHAERAGFAIVYEEDRRQVAIDQHRARIAQLASAATTPTLGMHLIQGATTRQKSQNMVAMLDAGQITVTLMIARRAD